MRFTKSDAKSAPVAIQNISGLYMDSMNNMPFGEMFLCLSIETCRAEGQRK
jgi:hypothetical protein